MTGRMKRAAGPLGVLGVLLACIPCLVPVIAVLGSVAALSTLSEFFVGNARMVLLSASSVIASLALTAYAVRRQRRRGAACETLRSPGAVAFDARRQHP